jgi:signal peptidase I
MSEKPYYQDEQFQTSSQEHRRASKKSGGALEYLIILLVSFALVFGFVRPFVMEAFWIPSGSMIPTLEIGDRVLVNKFIYRFTEPKRGDIVVFTSVDDPKEDLIKRVVGVPGDKIAVRDGNLLLNGQPQKESYVVKRACVSGAPKTCSFGPVMVPKGRVFVMGDNRANSYDSRFFGPVPEETLAAQDRQGAGKLVKIGQGCKPLYPPRG